MKHHQAVEQYQVSWQFLVSFFINVLLVKPKTLDYLTNSIRRRVS